jgi:uncharacterized protein YeaO (DUF488 family)
MLSEMGYLTNKLSPKREVKIFNVKKINASLRVKEMDVWFMPIFLKRAYEKSATEDGKRILVERLWPRGLKKTEAKIDEWLKDVAPSTELREWYSHDPSKWIEFKKRYWKELETKKDVVLRLAKESREGKVTFVFGSKEEKLNNANALKEYIENL